MTGPFLAAACDPGDSGFCPPSNDSFHLRHFVDFTIAGQDFWIDKYITLLIFGSVCIALFFILAARRATLVPGKFQFLVEGFYGFVRNGLAVDLIGKEGVKFAPYITTLFAFVLVMNFFGILPLAQLPVTAHIAFPIVLTALSWIIFNWVGIKRMGFRGYFKGIMFPPGLPKVIYVLIAPIEFISTIFVRPLTLALRLFANMFAGHLLLLVFGAGGIYLLETGNFSVIFGPFSILLAIILTAFEALIELLQAYIFALLTTLYIAGALAEEH